VRRLFNGLVAKELPANREVAALLRGTLLAARSFDREREVRKHISDDTLFLNGLFPEYVARLPRRSSAAWPATSSTAYTGSIA